MVNMEVNRMSADIIEPFHSHLAKEVIEQNRTSRDRLIRKKKILPEVERSTGPIFMLLIYSTLQASFFPGVLLVTV